jgi:hypothetical protein
MDSKYAVPVYGAPVPPRQREVPEIVPMYGSPLSPPRQPVVSVGQGSDITGEIYRQGLAQGRRQALTWMRQALDLFVPMARPTAMGAVLIDGLHRQIAKLLLSGDNPLEEDGDLAGSNPKG